MNIMIRPEADPKTPKEIVAAFLLEVRSGRHPERASLYLAGSVAAHQVNSENPEVVYRTPQDYSAHVEEFQRYFGQFEFDIVEMIAEGDKVYVRWTQRGRHLDEVDRFLATGLPLIEYTSVVYRVEHGRICEYWLQTDRMGMQRQLEANARNSAMPVSAGSSVVEKSRLQMQLARKRLPFTY